MSYLLQLVQALRYDKTDDVNHLSDLAKFLIQRGVNNPKIGVQFYWYILLPFGPSRSPLALLVF